MMTYEGRVCPPPDDMRKIAIVVSKFNRSITDRLLEGAVSTLKRNGVDDKDITVCWVPGAFEIPCIAARLAYRANFAAIICLGAVIRGETDHNVYINHAVSKTLSQIHCHQETPILFGILTCDSMDQAIARCGGKASLRDKGVDPTAGNKGAEVAEAALEMIDLISELPIAASSQRSDDDDDDDDDNDAEELTPEEMVQMIEMISEMAEQAGLAPPRIGSPRKKTAKKKVGKKPSK
ncbi:MAG: 6,7-dimethyl-8-ribityllumazine synthase [Thermoguttaceae bacterium]